MRRGVTRRNSTRLPPPVLLPTTAPAAAPAKSRHSTDPQRLHISSTRLAAFGDRREGEQEPRAPPQRLPPPAPATEAAGALPDPTLERTEEGTIKVKQPPLLLSSGDADGNGSGSSIDALLGASGDVVVDGETNGSAASSGAGISKAFSASSSLPAGAAPAPGLSYDDDAGAAPLPPQASESNDLPNSRKNPNEPVVLVFALLSIVGESFHSVAKELSVRQQANNFRGTWGGGADRAESPPPPPAAGGVAPRRPRSPLLFFSSTLRLPKAGGSSRGGSRPPAGAAPTGTTKTTPAPTAHGGPGGGDGDAGHPRQPLEKLAGDLRRAVRKFLSIEK